MLALAFSVCITATANRPVVSGLFRSCLWHPSFLLYFFSAIPTDRRTLKRLCNHSQTECLDLLLFLRHESFAFQQWHACCFFFYPFVFVSLLVWDVAAAPVKSMHDEQGKEDSSRFGLWVWETEGTSVRSAPFRSNIHKHTVEMWWNVWKLKCSMITNSQVVKQIWINWV